MPLSPWPGRVGERASTLVPSKAPSLFTISPHTIENDYQQTIDECNENGYHFRCRYETRYPRGDNGRLRYAFHESKRSEIIHMKKFGFTLTALILIAGLLAGCGSGGNNANAGNNAANTTNAAGAGNAGGNAPNEGNAEPAAAPEGSGEVNVYSARHYDVDGLLYEQFTQQTGIKVNVVEGKAEALIEQIKREGDRKSVV